MHVYKSSHSRVPAFKRCLIVKTDTYNREQIAKVLQVRANVEGLKLGPGVLDRLSAEGEKASLRYVIVPILNHPSPQSLPPVSFSRDIDSYPLICHSSILSSQHSPSPL